MSTDRLRAHVLIPPDLLTEANAARALGGTLARTGGPLAAGLVIVLVVSFISLGLRTGIVVALSVPLVLAIVFIIMNAMSLDLHRITLGALIIALGLLVDDAIIVVEMMVVKMEQGWDRVRAASFAWESTAFPMLTGTLVTAAGFLPIGFANSAVGEYAGGIFWIVAIALVAMVSASNATSRTATVKTGHALGGTVLVNRSGLTLYSLSAETGGRFICTGTCTSLWRPLVVRHGQKPIARLERHEVSGDGLCDATGCGDERTGVGHGGLWWSQ